MSKRKKTPRPSRNRPPAARPDPEPPETERAAAAPVEDASAQDVSAQDPPVEDRKEAAPSADETPRFRSYFDLLEEKYPDAESAPRVVTEPRSERGGSGGTTGVYPQPLLTRRRRRSGWDHRAVVAAVLALFAVGVLLAVFLTTTPGAQRELPPRAQERREAPPADTAAAAPSPSPDAPGPREGEQRPRAGRPSPSPSATPPAEPPRAPATGLPSSTADEGGEEDRAGEGRAGEGRAENDRAENDRAENDMAAEDRADEAPLDVTTVRTRRPVETAETPRRGQAARVPADAPRGRSEEPAAEAAPAAERDEASDEATARRPGGTVETIPAEVGIVAGRGPVIEAPPVLDPPPDPERAAADESVDEVLAADRPLRADDTELTPARRVFAPQPRYPEEARQAGEQGTVVLVGTIGADGAVRDARVLRGRTPALDRAALEAFRTWQFEPALLGGEAIESTYRVGISFRLDTDRALAPLPFGGDFVPPVRLSTPQPDYPPEAWNAGVRGVVVLEIVVDIEGRVQGIDVLQGLPAGVTEAAVAAVRRWTFRPATRKGVRVPVRHRVTLRFDPTS